MPQEERKETLSEKLWAAYREAPRPKPCAKELMEAFAFLKKAEPLIFKQKKGGAARGGVEVALDVCGGHGVLALLLVIYRKARRAIILDIDTPRSFGTMCTAWKKWLPRDDTEPVAVECRHGDVYTTLPAALAELSGSRVAVCGIHACDFLTDLCMESAMAACQDFAVMPCCHVDRHKGQLKQAATSCQISVGQVLDIMRLGRAWERGYVCHWRTIDRAITAENRVLVGTAPDPDRTTIPPTQISMKERTRLMERYHEYHKDSSADSLSDSLGCSEEGENDEWEGNDDDGGSVSVQDVRHQDDGTAQSSSEDELPCRCKGCGSTVSFDTCQLLEEEAGDNSEEGQGIPVSSTPGPPQVTRKHIEPEPEPDTLLSTMSLSSDVVVSVNNSTRTPAPVVRQTAPQVSPIEALTTLERTVSASLVLGADKTSATKTAAPSASEQREVSACIEELSQAIAGFVAHGSVGARLPRSAVVLGKAQSQLRALRKEAAAQAALEELRAKDELEAKATALEAEIAAQGVTPLISQASFASDSSVSSRAHSPTRLSSGGSRTQSPAPSDTASDVRGASGSNHMGKLDSPPVDSIRVQGEVEGNTPQLTVHQVQDAVGAEEEEEEEDDFITEPDPASAALSTPPRQTKGDDGHEDVGQRLSPLPTTPSSVKKHHPAWRTQQSWSSGGSAVEMKARSRTGMDGVGPILDSPG